MNDIVIKDSEAFEAIILSFEESLAKINELFIDQDNNIKKINSTGIWRGKLQNDFCRKYFELRENYDNIEDSFLTIIAFMKKTLDDYSRLEKQINTNIEDNVTVLDVN